MDAAGIGTGEEYGKDINSGTIEITGGKGMRLWTYSPSPAAGSIETVTNNLNWWSYVHGRSQAAFDVCDHPGYTEASCPYCVKANIVLR